MKSRTEEGMTILEVVIAITILLIGTGFVVQSNSLSYHYLGQQELRQQMVFFAAGAMEASLEGQSPPNGKFNTNYFDHTTAPPYTPPYDPAYNATTDPTLFIPKFLDGTPMPLTPFKISVSINSPGLSNVEMYNYRYNYNGQ